MGADEDFKENDECKLQLIWYMYREIFSPTIKSRSCDILITQTVNYSLL